MQAKVHTCMYLPEWASPCHAGKYVHGNYVHAGKYAVINKTLK